jgi:hypothetical protein
MRWCFCVVIVRIVGVLANELFGGFTFTESALRKMCSLFFLD